MINNKFSVLMSVYIKEKPEYLKSALESLFNQTLQPDEIVIVKDGPLTEALDNVIDDFKNDFKSVKIVQLNENLGLGPALREGVLNCSNEIVARMDSDDISVMSRFERQLNFFNLHPDIDIVGSYISEFIDNPDEIYSKRTVPLEHDKILKFAKWRNPMNHMTVMFKKQAVLESGNYEEFLFFEDYYLWRKMLQNGFRFANISESLVLARAGLHMIKRRKNFNYLLSETKLFLGFYKSGFINVFELIRNIGSKFFLRIIPSKFTEVIYNSFLRKEAKTN